MEEGSRENPPDDKGGTNIETMQNVNLEEEKNRLFKIARNNEQEEQSNLNELGRMLKSLRDADIEKLCQAKDEWENTVLHYAAKAGNLQICKLLVSRGADLSATGQNGMKVLEFAARYGDENAASAVWECMVWIASEASRSKSDLNNPRRSVRTEEICMTGDEEGMFEAQERDAFKFSILHHAIQNTNWVKNPVVVEKLISTKNFPITETDNQGNTCLHLAAQLDKLRDDKIFDVFFNNPSISQEEISKCIEARNNLGMTPLHIACSVGNQDSLNELLDACQESEIKVTKILNTVDKNGFLPLAHAIKSKNLEMVNTLLKEGAQATKDTMITAAR